MGQSELTEKSASETAQRPTAPLAPVSAATAVAVPSAQAPWRARWRAVAPHARVWLRRLLRPALIVIGLAYLKDVVFRLVLAAALTNVLGAPVEVRSASLHLLRPGVTIQRLVIAQPAGFTGDDLLRIREVQVRPDVLALLRGQIHVHELAVRVQQVHLIRDAQKRLNVDALKVVEAAKAETAAKPAELPPFKVDHAVLSVDRVVFTDFTKIKDGKPKVEVFDRVVREKKFENLTSVNQLVVAVLTQAMGPTALKSAGIAGAAVLAGATLLPVGILGVAVAKDSAAQVFLLDWNRTFDATQAFLRQNGTLKKADKEKGTMEAMVQGCRVLVSLKKLGPKMTHVTLSARKMLIPKPRIAAGLLYQLDQRVED